MADPEKRPTDQSQRVQVNSPLAVQMLSLDCLDKINQNLIFMSNNLKVMVELLSKIEKK